MRVYLVQHGEAVTKEVDADRPLTAQGESDVARVADFLKGAGISVDTVLHSGKTRARQTAEILAKAVLESGEVKAVSGISPNDRVDAFAIQINERAKDVMVVGHLPFMAKLVAQLVLNDDSTVIAAYRPGSVICLARDEDGCWLVQLMLRPELLRS